VNLSLSIHGLVNLWKSSGFSHIGSANSGIVQSLHFSGRSAGSVEKRTIILTLTKYGENY
jgi:hypothetical protein